MSKQKPKRQSKYTVSSQQSVEATKKPSHIECSFLIFIEDHHDKIHYLTDSLKNTNLNQKNFEIILSDNSADGNIRHELNKHDFLRELLNDKTIKIIPINPNSGFNDFIKESLNQACKDNIIILDINKLENPNFINDVISSKSIKPKKDKCQAVYFTQKQKQPNIRKSSFIIIPIEISTYLFSTYKFKKSSFHQELAYYCTRDAITIEPLVISQGGKDQYTHFNIIQSILASISLFTKYYIKVPIKELNNKSHLSKTYQTESSFYRFLFISISLLIFIILPILSYQAGTSGDEQTVYEQAEKSYNYYKTFGKDKSAIIAESADSRHSYGMMQYYGGTFDLLTYTINTLFKVDNEYEIRHVINGLTGCITILFAGLIVSLIAGWRAGIIAMIVLFISPRFLGHSFNNPKDIPFAMGYTISIYYFIKFIKELPTPRKSTFIGSIIGIAITVSLRIGGLLLIPYLILFVGLWFLINLPNKRIFSSENYNLGKKLIVYIFIISIFGYFIGLIFWPFGIENPVRNPFEALQIMTKFPVSLRQLFEGRLMWSDQLPWYYVIKYMIITIPLIILLGFVFFLIFVFKRKKHINNLYLFIISFSCIFPIFWVIYKESNLYGGMRHIMFAFVFFVIISVIGYEFLLHLLRNTKKKYIIYLLMLLLTIHPVRHIFSNHPYEYVYFNELERGIKGAYGNYELDYYFHSVREASEWIIKKVDWKKYSAENKLIVATNYGKSEMYYFRKYRDKVYIQYLRYYERGNFDWDYAIFVNTYIDPFQLKHNVWPPSNTVYTIDVDGKPICAVIQRKDKSDFFGFQALQKNDIEKAASLYYKNIISDPTNEIAYRNLIMIYSNQHNLDSVILVADRILKFYPDYDDALYYQGFALLQKNEFTKAQENFQRIIYSNFKSPYGYYGLAIMNYYGYKNINAALGYLKQGMEVTNPFKPFYILLAEIYKSQGNEALAKQVMEYANKM